MGLAFRGVFVGTDRYASTAWDWLSTATRDAKALYALFSDSFGANASTLLLDQDATRDRIRAEFDRLAQAEPDDLVVVAFSGHGTPTHELVTYDADPRDMKGTCVPLHELTEWFSRIPAKVVICILDCCFSGGMGAKVLHADAVPRSNDSTEKLLNQLAGEGRIILTASTANQEAWESSKLGHGYLTYYLIQALRGAEEVRSAGRISVYRLLEYVTKRVADSVASFGKAQNPTLRGSLDGSVTWPVLTRGPIFGRFFPEDVRQAATPQVSSLGAFGFPDHVIQAWQAGIPELNQLQLDAINEFGVLDGENLVVVAPTSAGKTMVGELAAMKAALERRRALFLLPLRAIVSDKHHEFLARYSDFGMRVIRATGEIADDIPALMRGQYDICLMTYEKCAALALGSPHLLEQVGVVVVDEVQMIADKNRGQNLEFLLTLLRVRQDQGIRPQLVALSGAVGDTNGLERWLDARLLRRNDRPVPLNEGVIERSGDLHFVDPGLAENRQRYITPDRAADTAHRALLIPLLRRLTGEGQQVIVFRETRGEARASAVYLSQSLGLGAAAESAGLLPQGDVTNASDTLRRSLEGGVAFHTADLGPEERRVVEERFRVKGSDIRVICATTTLAMGVNTPAESVVIVGLNHPDGPYSVAEYKNMVGRAGRLGFAERGSAFLIATTDHDAVTYWRDYVCRPPEDVESMFFGKGRDLRSSVLRVLAAAQQKGGAGLTDAEVFGFLGRNFAAFLAAASGREAVTAGETGRALSDLATRALVEQDEAHRYSLTALGRLAGEAGVEVESILRLVDMLRQVQRHNLSDVDLVSATQVTVELDDVLFPLNKKSTNKEPAAWPNELRRQGASATVLTALHRRVQDQHTATLRAKKSVSCLMWMQGSPLLDIEKSVTRFDRATDAGGAIRAVAQRTADLLPTTCRVAELIHEGLDLAERRAKLVARLELGIPAEAVEVAADVPGLLGRTELIALARADLSTLERLVAAPDDSLVRILSGDKAKASRLKTAASQALKRRKAESELQELALFTS